MKSILISIKPKYVAKILNGEKTIEIRKSMPKCDLPIDVYIYCTKDKMPLYYHKYKYYADLEWISCPYKLNGKVVAKFTLNKVDGIMAGIFTPSGEIMLCEQYPEILEKSCLFQDDLDTYLNDKLGYAWHISNLVIFDKPKELGEFKRKVLFTNCNKCQFRVSEYLCDSHINCTGIFDLTKAPQSWQFIETEELE